MMKKKNDGRNFCRAYEKILDVQLCALIVEESGQSINVLNKGVVVGFVQHVFHTSVVFDGWEFLRHRAENVPILEELQCGSRRAWNAKCSGVA